MQINLKLLKYSRDVKDNLFHTINNTAIFTNNDNECIRKRQQGGVLYLVKNNLTKCVKGLDKYLLGLGRWV